MKTRSKRHITTQNIASGVTPLQRGPTCQRKRAPPRKMHKREDKDKIPRINHPAIDQHERLTGGASRTRGSAEPGLQDVQVHFRE